MAGIGFELRRILDRDSYLDTVRAYGYAGVIGSGPWVLSIVGVTLVGLLCVGRDHGRLLSEYWSCVTYVIAGSLILTGFLQLQFTRFVADRCYEKREDLVLPNLMGALFLTTVVAGLVGSAVAMILPPERPPSLRILLTSNLVVLSDIWVVVVFVTGLKAYKAILRIFASSYAAVVLLSYVFREADLDGLLLAFMIGHVGLLFALLGLVIYCYPSDRLVGFEFLHRNMSFYSLGVTGFLYNFGVWADKIVFWSSPTTSDAIIGPLVRGSAVYDFPVYIAYLTILPGMAVFLFRIETDFADYYDRFYQAVRGGGTLQDIELLRNGMVVSVRNAIHEVFKVQGWFIAFCCLFGPTLLESLGCHPIHAQLFRVLTVGVGLLVLVLAMLNVFFYLDNREAAMKICGVFAFVNLFGTLITLWLGPQTFGYGFVCAGACTAIYALRLLHRQFDQLEFETFMLRN